MTPSTFGSLAIVFTFAWTSTLAGFSPQSRDEFWSACKRCLVQSSKGDCESLGYGPIGEWNVTGVTDMDRTFQRATRFNVDISKWDVSRVTDMRDMFQRATSFNADISKWNVSRVTNMGHMFRDATSFNADISKWDVSRVTNMYRMFFYAYSFKRVLCGLAWIQSKADKIRMFDGSGGSIGLSTFVCIPNWSTEVIVPIAIVVIIVIIVTALCCRARALRQQRLVRQRFLEYGDTEEYQNEVRREWLRGLHALTSGSDHNDRVPRFPRVIRDDLDVSQLLEFFHKYPGLRRQIGGIMSLYHSPSSAPGFCSDKYKDTQVEPLGSV